MSGNTSNDDGSTHSGSSARRSSRVSNAPQRLISVDTHEQDLQKLDEQRQKKQRERKRKSRSRHSLQEQERDSQRATNKSPDKRLALQERKRVANMSPEGRRAQQERKRVANMSSEERRAQQERKRVANMSSEEKRAQQERDRVANMSPKRKRAHQARDRCTKKALANQRRYTSEHHSSDDADSESSDVEPPSAVSKDAHNYAKAIQATCEFFMCAVCAWEGGIDSMIELNGDIREMLSKNTTLPEEFFHLRSDESEDGIDYNYRRRVCIEMEEPGVLKGIRHICSKCHGKAKCGKSTSRAVIPYSMAGGLFCGEPPDVLKNLWAVEVSMVALINPIVTLAVESAYANISSKPNSFCIENDVIQIAQKLPRLPSKDNWAVFMHQGFGGKPDSQHQYRPYYVYEALQWLKENNAMYRDVVMEFPDAWNAAIQDAQRTIAVESTEYTADDVAPVRRPPQQESEEVEEAHPANPSGLPSREFFLVKSTDYGPTLEQLKAVARSAQRPTDALNTPIFRRSLLGANIVQRHEAPDFDAMAFPVLYPYGFGHVPGKSIDVNYVCHRICSGGYYRRFQQTPNYLYTHYSFEMKRTVGGISVLAANKSGSDAMTTQDARDLLSYLRDEDGLQPLPAEKMARIRRIMRMVAPFAQKLPGTKVVMDQEKNKMRSLVNSPVTREAGHWRWFVTHAQSDLFSPLLYDNIVTSTAPIDYYDIEQRQEASDKLTKDERVTLMRQNPVIASRIWDLQQTAFFNHVINGEALPLGGKVIDRIKKNEVQDKGSEHGHEILSIQHDQTVPRAERITDEWLEDAALQDETKRTTIENMVSNVVTAKLLGAADDQAWDWKEAGAQDIFSERFPDTDHPLRLRFDPNLDYSVHPVTKEPNDPAVRRQYRRIQSASFGHVCRHSCWKYKTKKKTQRHSKSRSKLDCRYGHPVPEHQKVRGGIFKHRSDRAQVCSDYDRKGRKRRRVLPARNNAHLAPSPVSPLMMLAHLGNSNIQYISNVFGALEYFVNYVGKVDEPECKDVINSVIRLLSLYATDAEPKLQSVFKAVMNALTRERTVRATQVADFFLGHQVLTYTRSIKTVNPRPRCELSRHLNMAGLDRGNNEIDDDPAIQSKQARYRDAYSKFAKDQYARFSRCNVSFFSFLTSFDETVRKRTRVDEPPPLFECDPFSGIVSNSQSFTTEDCATQFTAHAKASVVHLVPYAPVNLKDEKSCFALLLLYIPWPNGSEDEMLGDSKSAIEAWKNLEECDNVPAFAKSIVSNDIRRQELDVGEPGETDGSDNDEVQPRPRRDSLNVVDYNISSSVDDEGALCSESDGEDDANSDPVSAEHVSRISQHQFETYENFIKSLDARLSVDEISVRKFSQSDLQLIDQHPGALIRVGGHEAAETALQQMMEKLTPDQKSIFETISQCILDPGQNSFFSFLSGQGGVGKSEVFKALKLWCDVTFGKTAGDYGSCLLCAPTGMSAFNIKGTTWHRAFKKSGYEQKVLNIDDVERGSIASLQGAFRGVQLIIFDELSLINIEQLWEINIKLKIACNDKAREQKLFGGFNILLGGDLFQLPPVGGKSVVVPLESLRQCHATTQTMKLHFMNDLTHFFELKENIRARCEGGGVLSPFAAALSNLRIGQLTSNDTKLFNGCFCTPDIALQRANPKAIWIFASNQECKQFNDACTERLVKQGNFRIRIVAQHKDNRGDTPPLQVNAQLLKIPLKCKKTADEVRVPYLDLAIGSRVKTLDNLCIRAGIVNGAVGTVVGFRFVNDTPPNLKPSISSFDKDESIPNREIPVVLVQFDYDEKNEQDCERALANSCMPDVPNVFPIVALESHVKLKIQGNAYVRWQVPLALSHGRTCHSCQGLTAHDGAVVTVSTRFFNFAYVASSRAKDSQQLLFLPCASGPNQGTMCFFEDLQHKYHSQRGFIEDFYAELRERFGV